MPVFGSIQKGTDECNESERLKEDHGNQCQFLARMINTLEQ
jgi:hypothetical protein